MQSFEFGSELGYRPTCPKCDIPMMTVCVEPLGDGIRRTFECPQCDRFKIRKVKAQ
jgi:primosomal protein N'